MRCAAPVRMAAEASSLSLHELNKDAPGDDDLIAHLQPGGNVVLIRCAIAERYVATREATVGLSDIYKGQVLIVAQDRRHRDQQADALLARLDQYAHIHLLLQEVSRVLGDHAHLN